MNTPPLPSDIEAACRLVIANWELERFVEPLLKATKVALVCESSKDVPLSDVPVGSTKLGGFPDLPAHVTWPTYNDRYLPFIAQVDLAKLPNLANIPLPRTGRLCYFYWCTNEVRERPAVVLWLNDDKADFTRREVPPDQILADWQGVSIYQEEMATRFSYGVSVSTPLARTFADEMGLAEALDELELWDFVESYADEVSIYLQHGLDVWDRMRAQGIDTTEQGISIDHSDLIKLLGHPDPYDHHLGMTCTPEGHSDGTDVWHNILHIYSSNNMLWSDVGSLGFFIRDDNLRRRDFSRVVVEIMSG